MHTDSIQQLAYRLKEAKRRGQQRFIFFLGAGASESSGIPIAEYMRLDFERKLKEVWESEPSPKKAFYPWVKSKPGWKDNKGESDYAKWFEAYDPAEDGRREYLDEWMAAASPGWGYFWLAQLLARSYVGVVVTTNFDDLIYESCTKTSIVRPRVYSTLDPYVSVELARNRPTIIKLHGDYLYGRFKNTRNDKTDEELMGYVASLCQGYDIIVLGYGGQDKRIMKDLFAKVPSTHSVYWCTYKETQVPEKVKKIVRDSPAHWFKVRTEGFDEFMDELVHELGFPMSSIMQPIQNLVDAIPGRIEGSPSLYVSDYLDDAIKQIQQEETQLANAQGVNAIPQTRLRLRLEAMDARLKREYEKAIKSYDHLVQANQATCEVLIEYAVTLELMGNYSEAAAQISRIEEKLVDDAENLGNFGWLLANLGKYEDGINRFKRAIIKGPGIKQWPVALAMILSEDGQIEEALNHARVLTDMNPSDGRVWATRSMIESLAGFYTTSALECGNKAVGFNPRGFDENLALAFALSGSGDHDGAISALKQIVGEEDPDIRHRCLGHFQVLAGDFDSAVENLQKAIKFTKPAKRPKILALHGVALLAQGNREEAQETFKSATSARDPVRHYKADDDLAFALCELGAGRTEPAVSRIQTLSDKYRQMRGLLVELSALLGVMKSCEIEGCDQCIASIDSALDAGSS